jgi:NAD-dependent deacetylase
LVYDIDDWELESGKTCEKGSQLRPHIVWFGEAVPKMTDASIITESADVLIVIGTSLNVYPAAGLIDIAEKEIQKYLIDPNEMNVSGVDNLTIIKEKASTGVPKLAEKLSANA